MKWVIAFVLLLSLGSVSSAKSGRWSPEEYEQQPRKGLVWAKGAASSSFASNSFKPEGALGAADVFPKFDVSARIWSPKSTSSNEDWLEVTFPKTRTKQIRIFETTRPGCISKVVDVETGDVLHEERVVNALHRFSGARVLHVDLAAPRVLTKVRVFVRPKDAGFSRPGIDAVALLPAEGEAEAAPAPASEEEITVSTGHWSVDDYKAKAADMARAVWPTSAKASSQMGAKQSASHCVGKPLIWPKHKMGIPFKGGAWAPKSSSSSEEWLTLNYSESTITSIHVFETHLPGQVWKVELDGKTVYDQRPEKGAYKRFNQRAQVFWLTFSAPVSAKSVKLWFSPAIDYVRPGIDTVGLIPVE